MRAQIAIVVAAGITCLAPAAGGRGWAGQKSDLSVETLLTAYAVGKYELVTDALRTYPDLRQLARSFPGDATAWTNAVVTNDRPRRLRIAAVVMLELVRAALERPSVQYESLRAPLEAVCAAVRQHGGSRFTRLWLLASVALLEGARDERLLVGRTGQPDDAEGHAIHSAQAFPDEPRFQLARIVSRHEAALIGSRPGLPDIFLVFNRYGQTGPRGETRSDAANRVEQTVRELQNLTTQVAVAAEAHLRIGVIRFLQGRINESQRHLAAAALSATEPFIAGLAELLRGFIARDAGERAAAEQAFRRAVEMHPRGYATRIALAAFLFADGRHEEAAALVDGASKPDPDRRDPWRDYSHGDLRFYDRYLRQLREELQK